jgi:hypothetical protein
VPNHAHSASSSQSGHHGGGAGSDMDFEKELKKFDEKFAKLKKNLDKYDDLGTL